MIKLFVAHAIAMGLLLFPNSSTFAASATKPVTPDAASVIEVSFFKYQKAKNFEELVQASGMTGAHKKEVMAFLKGHSLTNSALPQARWIPGTATMVFSSAKMKRTVDYSQIAKRQVSIDGKNISIPADARFSDIEKLFRQSKGTKGAHFGFSIINEAQAGIYDPPPVETSFLNGFLYYTASDQLLACVGSDEGQFGRDCPYRSDFAMIKAAIEPYEIRGIDCTGDKLHKFEYNEYGGPASFEVEYNKEGSVDGMFLLSRDTIGSGIRCEYKFDEDESLLYAAGESGLCYSGRVTNRKTGLQLKKGDQPRGLTLLPVSLTRLKSCCQSTECRGEISREVASQKKAAEKAKRKYEQETGALQ